MTYCVGMVLDEGLVFASDSRTNAGVDHVSTFCKMTVFENPGQGVIVMLNSGNLATTQQVISRLRQQAQDTGQALTDLTSMFSVAERLGRELRQTITLTRNEAPDQSDIDFSATFLVGGQLKGEAPRLFLVYPQGNFIESTRDTPFFQIGESKYGKPILDRVIQPSLNISQAIKCALVSFDSTIKSNLSVACPSTWQWSKPVNWPSASGIVSTPRTLTFAICAAVGAKDSGKCLGSCLIRSG